MSDQKTFLITGDNSGLGKAFAANALAAGHRVVSVVRSERAASEFIGISEALGKEVRHLGIHVTALAPGQFRTDNPPNTSFGNVPGEGAMDSSCGAACYLQWNKPAFCKRPSAL